MHVSEKHPPVTPCIHPFNRMFILNRIEHTVKTIICFLICNYTQIFIYMLIPTWSLNRILKSIEKLIFFYGILHVCFFNLVHTHQIKKKLTKLLLILLV